MATIDISSSPEGPAAALSNFAAHEFIFRGEHCASMEGLLQSLKHPDPDKARATRALVGKKAKFAGQKKKWWLTQELFWDGQAFDRHGPVHGELVDEAFDAMFTQNEAARAALLATGDAVLTHDIGCEDPTRTILTTTEFCDRLTAIRTRLTQ